jgi:hypothetical protein
LSNFLDRQESPVSFQERRAIALADPEEAGAGDERGRQ